MHLSGTHDCSSKRIGSRSIWALYLCENEKRKNSKSGKNTAVDTLTIGRCSGKNHIVRCGMLISGHMQMVALAKCISLYERLSADSFSTSSFLFYLRGAANSHQMRVLIGSITLSCSLAPSQIGKYVRHSTMCVTHTKTVWLSFAKPFPYYINMKISCSSVWNANNLCPIYRIRGDRLSKFGCLM